MTVKEFLEKKNYTIMNNREKINVADLYDQEITFEDFEIREDESGKEYAVVTVKEFPDKFFFAGKVLTDIVKELLETFGDAVHTMMNDEDIKFKLTQKKTKKGQIYTNVTFVD